MRRSSRLFGLLLTALSAPAGAASVTVLAHESPTRAEQRLVRALGTALRGSEGSLATRSGVPTGSGSQGLSGLVRTARERDEGVLVWFGGEGSAPLLYALKASDGSLRSTPVAPGDEEGACRALALKVKVLLRPAPRVSARAALASAGAPVSEGWSLVAAPRAAPAKAPLPLEAVASQVERSPAVIEPLALVPRPAMVAPPIVLAPVRVPVTFAAEPLVAVAVPEEPARATRTLHVTLSGVGAAAGTSLPDGPALGLRVGARPGSIPLVVALDAVVAPSQTVGAPLDRRDAQGSNALGGPGGGPGGNGPGGNGPGSGPGPGGRNQPDRGGRNDESQSGSQESGGATGGSTGGSTSGSTSITYRDLPIGLVGMVPFDGDRWGAGVGGGLRLHWVRRFADAAETSSSDLLRPGVMATGEVRYRLIDAVSVTGAAVVEGWSPPQLTASSASLALRSEARLGLTVSLW